MGDGHSAIGDSTSVALLQQWMRKQPHPRDAPLFPNARGVPMTRSGIEQRLRVMVTRATSREASLVGVQVSPHVIRHTTAMHLLQSGVDLTVIAMWLGHENI